MTTLPSTVGNRQIQTSKYATLPATIFTLDGFAGEGDNLSAAGCGDSPGFGAGVLLQ